MKLKLTDQDFEAAAQRLGCEVAAIRAVADVESGRWGAFLPSDRPVILFERHRFRGLTGGRFDASHPDLSHPTAGGYGTLAEQYRKLARAIELDRTAALKATSWGLFQILGENHVLAGYPDLDAFVTAMEQGVDEHLEAFVSLVRNRGLAKYLRTQDWNAFARAYNGPAYRRRAYPQRLAVVYWRAVGAANKPAQQPPSVALQTAEASVERSRLSMLKGRKTYLVALLMVGVGLGGLVTGKISPTEAVQLVLEGLAAAGLRAGIASTAAEAN